MIPVSGDEIGRYRSLIAAVVSQAISDWRAADAARVRKDSFSPEPRRWLTSASEAPFSFRWCCEELDIAPDTALSRLGL